MQFSEQAGGVVKIVRFVQRLILVGGSVGLVVALSAPCAGNEREPGPGRDDVDLSIGLGVGVADLVHGDLRLSFSRYVAAGFGIGFLRGEQIIKSILKTKGKETLSVSDAEYQFGGDSALISMAGYARAMPLGKAWFLGGSLKMWLLQGNASGTVENPGGYLGDVDLETSVRIIYPLLGLHTGWSILTEKGLILEFQLGIEFVLAPRSHVTLQRAGWEGDGWPPSLAVYLEDMHMELAEKVDDRVERFARRRRVLPSGAIRLGWAFDFVAD